jgi:hypothetical protein
LLETWVTPSEWPTKTPASLLSALLSQTLTRESSLPVKIKFEFVLFAKQTEFISSSCAFYTLVLILLAIISNTRTSALLVAATMSFVSPENLSDIIAPPL